VLKIEIRLLDDLAWREDEIVVLKTACALESESTPKGRSLRRAYLAMLYSHYEGFSKFAWEECLIEISKSGYPLSRLRPSLCNTFIRSEISTLRTSANSGFIDDVFSFRCKLLNQIPSTYENFETSNLWPNVFTDVLNQFGMSSDFVERNKSHLKGLVGRRNEIAHGKNIGIDDNSLQDLHDSVFDVFFGFTVEIVRYCAIKGFIR